MVEMTLFPDGVVVVVEKEQDLRHTAESMTADVAAYRELTQNQTLPVLWDVRAMGRPTPEGWRAFLSEVPEALSALALLVDDESRRIAGAFPEVMDAFLFPSQVFLDRDEAYQWLLQHVPPDFVLESFGGDGSVERDEAKPDEDKGTSITSL